MENNIHNNNNIGDSGSETATLIDEPQGIELTPQTSPEKVEKPAENATKNETKNESKIVVNRTTSAVRLSHEQYVSHQQHLKENNAISGGSGNGDGGGDVVKGVRFEK